MLAATANELKQSLLSSKKSPTKLILGTDWWTDCDDCVAVRLLAWAHNNGVAQLMGVALNGCMDYSAASLNAFMTFYGIGDLPIGIDFDGTDFAGDYLKYQEPLCAFPHRIQKNSDCDTAVRLYRRLLYESDSKVDIIEIGFMQVIAGLLESEPDDISPLNGIEIARSKIGKLWIMAGKWDEEHGMEHNFNNNFRSHEAADKLCRLCPVPITFLGFEVGESVITGSRLSDEKDALRIAMCAHGSAKGRSSWDPMTALLAVTGDEKRAGYDKVIGTASVNPSDGSNSFVKNPDGLHSYVVKTQPDSFYRDLIDSIIE